MGDIGALVVCPFACGLGTVEGHGIGNHHAVDVHVGERALVFVHHPGVGCDAFHIAFIGFDGAHRLPRVYEDDAIAHAAYGLCRHHTDGGGDEEDYREESFHILFCLRG